MRQPARLLSIVLAALSLIACEETRTEPEQEPIVINLPPREPGEEKIKLDDLAEPLPDAPKFATHRLIVRTLLYERGDARLAVAADMLDDPPITPRRLELWADNGFRFGVTDRARLPLLLGNLPRPVHSEVASFHTASVFNPLTLVDKVVGRTRVRIVQADGSATFRRFAGGQYQFLFRIHPERDGEPTRLELLPHRYSPLRSLMMRSPEQQMLEGDSFSQLQLAEPMRPDEVWVITAAEPGSSTGGRESNPREAESHSLAQAMLTGRSRGKDVQILLLITLEPNPAKH